MSPKIELIQEIPNVALGEGPHWDIQTQSLFFVDITGMGIHRYIPATKQHSQAFVGKPVSFIVPVAGNCKKFVIGLEREICIVHWDGISDVPEKMEKICDIDVGTQNRTNDAKCDPKGRLWVGTMGAEPILGQVEKFTAAFYSLTNTGNLTTHLQQISISNGLTWNTELKKFYYNDTSTDTVDEFDYDIDKGTISNRRVIFSLKKNNIDGSTDGMTIDTDGNLWVALYDGFKIIKIDPRKPETLLQTIELPAKQITSLTWGGPNLDILYVTSARKTANPEEMPQPIHGGTFQITDLNAKGLPADNFIF